MNANIAGVKIILSALWVAAMFVWQQGDVQRIYAGEFVPGETKLGEMVSPGLLATSVRPPEKRPGQNV